MEDDILNNNVDNFSDAVNAFNEFLNNFEIEENKKEEITIQIFKNILQNKNLIFKDLE